MLFTQIEFLILIAILIAFLFFMQKRSVQKGAILVSSLYFYSYWDYRFLLLLLFSSAANYVFGRLINTAGTVTTRRILYAIIVTTNLVLLGFFKYFNFFIENIRDIPGLQNLNLHTMVIILPLGISFYTFRLISYCTDIKRGSMKPCDSILDFTIFSTFFPIILSGPISRASYFLPQLKSFSITGTKIYEGFRLFAIGLFLKVFVADRVGMYVNIFYDNTEVFSTLSAWLAVFAYSLQIYSDFAGYSSMAIGIALTLGIRIEENFNFPYLSTSITEFWRRWHITLSTWIRDYIYIPMGGNRKGRGRTTLNLLLSMTLCGLWHGAAWTFVYWGFFHGVALVLNHLWRNKERKIMRHDKEGRFFSWFLTTTFVVLGWVLFRSVDMNQAITILKKLIIFQGGVTWYEPSVIFLIAATIIIHTLKAFRFTFVELPSKAIYTPTVLFTMLWLVIVFHPSDFQPFVYLQF